MKKLYLLAFLSFSMSMGVAQELVMDTVYFAFDRAEVTDEYKMRMDSLIGFFTAYPSYFVQIYGHTDSIGTDAYNLELSESRAREVALYLRDQGIDLKRVEYEGLGTTKPIGSNLTYSGRRKNRRADVAIIVSNEVVAPVYPTDEDSTEVAEAAEELGPVFITDTIYCDYNPFLINPTHKTVIIAPEGTKVIVPPNAFDTDAEELSVEVNELYFRSDMIVNEMPTISREGPLESPGMFFFDIRANRRPVKMLPGISFEAEIPSTRRDADMVAYSGSGGSRGGRRSPRGSRQTDAGVPGFNAVKTWNAIKDEEVQYKGRDKVYTFSVPSPGRYAVGRPLYLSQNTDPEDKGLDIFVKLKGRRFEKTTNVMIVGEVVKTYIPVKKKDRRNFEAKAVKWIDDETKLVLVAIQYDDRGYPYIAKRSFTPGDLLKETKRDRKRKRRDLPNIKMKVKFRKVTKERLNELITELNV